MKDEKTLQEIPDNAITLEAMDTREMIEVILEQNAEGNKLIQVVWEDDERLDYELKFINFKQEL